MKFFLFFIKSIVGNHWLSLSGKLLVFVLTLIIDVVLVWDTLGNFCQQF